MNKRHEHHLLDLIGGDASLTNEPINNLSERSERITDRCDSRSVERIGRLRPMSVSNERACGSTDRRARVNVLVSRDEMSVFANLSVLLFYCFTAVKYYRFYKPSIHI